MIQWKIQDEIFIDSLEDIHRNQSLNQNDFYGLASLTTSSENDLTLTPFVFEMLSLNGADLKKITEVDCFNLFYSNEIKNLILTNTNAYASWKSSSNEFFNRTTKTTGYKQWNKQIPNKTMDIPILNMYMGVRMLMGLVVCSNVDDYWNVETGYEPINKVMTRDQYEAITECMHFSHLYEPLDHPLEKNLNLLQLFQKNFVQCVTIGKIVVIDESMDPTKHHLSFSQFNAKKRNRRGIKHWTTVDAKTRYIWKIIPYLGKTDFNEGTLGENVIKNMSSGLENKQKIIVADNFFSAPSLVDQLNEQKIGYVGTQRPNRKGLPPEVKQTKNILYERGNMKTWFHEGKILSSWIDTDTCHFITNLLPSAVSTTVKRKIGAIKQRVKAPLAAFIYNRFKAGVDVTDQNLESLHLYRRNPRWQYVMFWSLIGKCLVNARVVYCKIHNIEYKKLPKMTSFTRQIALQLISNRTMRNDNPGRPKIISEESRVGLHVPEYNDVGSDGYPKRKYCIMTHTNSKRRRTSIHCNTCRKDLCRGECFETFHSTVETQTST